MMSLIKSGKCRKLSSTVQNVRNFSFYISQNYNEDFKKKLESQHIVKSDKEYRFAIIGCGPAGFYCAKQILKNVAKVRVDIFDKNPHPYGLVRTGVAPDHPEMKKIERDYQEVLNDQERCRFFGNVLVGTNGGIPIEKLKEMYSGVVLAYGATSERKLGLPNEYSLKGVLSSRKIVNWYNGSLDVEIDSKEDLNLENVHDVAIVGNGNVALDISRILLKDPQTIAPYDMPSSVVDYLSASKVKNVQLIGRRGLVQSAFTIKEIREVSRINKVNLYIVKDELQRSLNEASLQEMGAGHSIYSRAYERKTEFLKTAFKLIESQDQYQEILADKSDHKNFILRYLWNPVELISEDGKRISKLKLLQMELKGEPDNQKAFMDPANKTLEIDCQLLIKSIGYQSRPIQGIPFDNKTSTVPHDKGCVLDDKKQQIPGLYVAGWLKRGPVGIIDSTLRDSVDTFRVIKHHLECDMLQEKKTSIEEVNEILPKGKRMVSFDDWKKIDKVEKDQGQQKGKTREKILDKNEMLKIIQ